MQTSIHLRTHCSLEWLGGREQVVWKYPHAGDATLAIRPGQYDCVREVLGVDPEFMDEPLVSDEHVNLALKCAEGDDVEDTPALHEPSLTGQGPTSLTRRHKEKSHHEGGDGQKGRGCLIVYPLVQRLREQERAECAKRK